MGCLQMSPRSPLRIYTHTQLRDGGFGTPKFSAIDLGLGWALESDQHWLGGGKIHVFSPRNKDLFAYHWALLCLGGVGSDQ